MSERTSILEILDYTITRVKTAATNGNMVLFYDEEQELLFMADWRYLFDSEGNRFNIDTIPEDKDH